MNKVKTIGIDARFYGEAGPGRYAKNIIQHLEKLDTKNKYLIFLRKRGFDEYKPENPNFKKVLTHYKWYSFEEQIFFLIKILKFKPDLLYVPHFNIPVLYPKKIVTAIPDIIMHTYSTEEGTTLPKFYFRFKKLVYYFVVLWAVIRSKKVIVPSNDVKKDFINTYPFIPESKFVLAYEGIDPDFITVPDHPESVLEKYNIKKPFLLYVSSMYEHKNVGRLIEMHRILKSKYGYKMQLVLVGKNDKFAQKIYENITKENLQNEIIMPGIKNYVSDGEVVALRTQAELYIFPSLKEGFSLTPLEGQKVGLASAISDISSHKEIYEDSVSYFNPYDPSDIAEKVDFILKNPSYKNVLVEKGYKQAKKYDWLNTAKITLEVLENS